MLVVMMTIIVMMRMMTMMIEMYEIYDTMIMLDSMVGSIYRLQGKPQHKVIASPSSPFSSAHLVFHHQQLRGQSLVIPRHQHQIPCGFTYINSLMTYLVTKQMMILIMMMVVIMVSMMVLEMMVECRKLIDYKGSHSTKSWHYHPHPSLQLIDL